jgi:hypothetical protein
MPYIGLKGSGALLITEVGQGCHARVGSGECRNLGEHLHVVRYGARHGGEVIELESPSRICLFREQKTIANLKGVGRDVARGDDDSGLIPTC